MTSCVGLHKGYITNSTSLSENNFTYVTKNLQGSSTVTYVLGIGGLAKSTLVNTAKQKMLENNPLKDNQALVNLTVNWKSSNYVGIYITLKCTVTADVVEFK